jgi:hypothetical protein
LCGLETATDLGLEGNSLADLLHGNEPELFSERILVAQGNTPEKFRSSVMWNKWRLVNGTELYNLEEELAEETDVSAENPEIVAKLREYYDGWWPEIRTPEELPPYFVTAGEELKLTGYDWIEEGNAQIYNWPHLRRGEKKNGRYMLVFEQAGRYSVSLRRWPKEADTAITAGVPAFDTFDPFGDPNDDWMGPLEPGVALDIRQARVKIGDDVQTKTVGSQDKEVTFEFEVAEGQTFLQTWFIDAEGTEFGAYYIYIKKSG